MSKTIYHVLGLMSGTSMDGVDAALLETDGQHYIIPKAYASLTYPAAFTQALKKAEQALRNHPPAAVAELPALTQQSADYHRQVIEQLLRQMDSAKEKPDFIGYHGQTLCHRPHEKFSLQIGAPQFLADYFHLPVVFNFRQNDLQHGGQGAPLAPLYHQALVQQRGWSEAVIVNCGGIANISVIRTSGENIIQGFDTGPGNVLLDRFVRQRTKGANLFDKDGRYAQAGIIHTDLLPVLWEKTLRRAQGENYYELPPPKSLDSQEISFIPEIAAAFPPTAALPSQALYDGCATLAAFTGLTIARSCVFIAEPVPTNWIIAGGGAKNPAIVHALQKYLRDYLPQLAARVQTADEANFSSTYLEAELMAWLAVRSRKQLPLTLPQTTGVSRPVTGGEWFYPRQLLQQAIQ